MKKLDPQVEFYKELDSSKNKKGYCNCLSFAIFFALILILVESVLFLFIGGLRSRPSNPEASVSSGNSAVFSKVDLGGGNFEVVISEGVLCSKMSEQKGFKDLKCLISTEGIEISGKLGSLFPSNSKVVLMPFVEKERLKFEVRQLKIGKISCPKKYANPIAFKLGDLILADLPDLNNASVESVEATEGLITIQAKNSI